MTNIGFVSTRIAGTDGVSLEIYKWYQILKRNGYSCFFYAGELHTPVDRSFLVPQAHFDDPEIMAIHYSSLGSSTRESETTKKILKIADNLKSTLYDFCNTFSIDILIPENALAIPMNIPLGIALTQFIAETGIKTIAHHHDFSWERERFLVNGVQDFLNYAFPPVLDSLAHVVINTEASRQLSYRRGVSTMVIPNVFDFASPPKDPLKREQLRKKLGFEENDLFILQPTRVVPRKWIERAVELVSHLELKKPSLVISHESGDEGDTYEQEIKEYAQRLDVEVQYIGDKVGTLKGFNDRVDREYTLDDLYQCSDLVTYPSGYEGFGNAFIEAVYFKKPIFVNRYPVYIEDIETLGFEVISFDGVVTKDVAQRVKDFLESSDLNRIVENNYSIGKQYFSYEVLEKKLLSLIANM